MGVVCGVFFKRTFLKGQVVHPGRLTAGTCNHRGLVGRSFSFLFMGDLYVPC